MALFYLIRHGEPDYDKIREVGFWGFGTDFAPLTENGLRQAEITAKDVRLKDADIIISSPYTRALQTAHIISREIGLSINVEHELHEWLPDLENRYTTSKEVIELTREFHECQGEYPDGEKMRWETLSHMQDRMKRVADKYSEYEKVIIVGHGMTFRCLTHIENMNCGEIIECIYPKEQGICEFMFDSQPNVIGKTVNVTIDRPLGSYHPEYTDMYYPINYGYVEGIMAPDGEEQDVYILGVDEPVESFTGKIIAIVKRADDVEVKWVASPENASFTKEEIREQIQFQEQYFQSEIVMNE